MTTTDRVALRRAIAAAAFAEASPLAPAPAGAVGFRLALERWDQQRVAKGNATRVDGRSKRVVRVTWRPTWEPLNLNYSGSPWHTRAATSTVRHWIATEAGPLRHALPSGDFLTIGLVYRPPADGTRDAMNLAKLQKACVDGLVRGRQKYRTDPKSKRRVELPGLDLVPDDTPRYVDERAPQILPAGPAGTDGLWLDVIVHNPKEAP